MQMRSVSLTKKISVGVQVIITLRIITKLTTMKNLKILENFSLSSYN